MCIEITLLFVQQLGCYWVRCIWGNLGCESATLNNCAPLFDVENGRSFSLRNINVWTHTDGQSVWNQSGLSDRIEMATVHEIKASIDETSAKFIFFYNFFVGTRTFDQFKNWFRLFLFRIFELKVEWSKLCVHLRGLFWILQRLG